jgi:hypothetical protein
MDLVLSCGVDKVHWSREKKQGKSIGGNISENGKLVESKSSKVQAKTRAHIVREMYEMDEERKNWRLENYKASDDGAILRFYDTICPEIRPGDPDLAHDLRTDDSLDAR